MRNMTWLVLVLFSCLFIVGDVCAESDIRTLNIEGDVFVSTTPTGWKRVKAEEPFVWKFIHESGKRECFITCSCWNGQVGKQDLLHELFDIAEGLYGNNFWDKPNYQGGSIYDEQTDRVFFFFEWDKGDIIERVHIVIFQDFSKKNCCKSMVFVSKLEKPVSAEGNDFFSEDFKTFLYNVW